MESQEAYEVIEGIAIIGMAGRFPGAKTVEEFWQNLQNGIESISCLTDEELISAGIKPDVLNDSNYVKTIGILEDIDLFDASFFDINPKEAEVTDPQHRLFLECAWEALESAGYDSQRCESRIGVYGGASLNHYLDFDLNKDQLGSAKSYQKLIGNAKDFLTTRVSYKLNLTGPSITVQTACSTSLVATTLAYQSLLNYQCDIALVGGVSIRVPHKTGYLYQQGGTLSPDGHCRAFDAQAQGTTIGNGVGVVVLKRLKDAVADGDCIYAVIKGTAINNDGSLKVGYTAPSVDGQALAIAEAMMLASVEPETINYIEAHGTGTALGDPIEIAALSKVFRASTNKKGFCAIGSVKTNIGHLDAAAGVAGLIKAVLALKHELIPPSLNFEQPNPQIDFANSPFFVNTKLMEWKCRDVTCNVSTPRRAGVSSLGMGGTNAHVILEEAPNVEPSSPSRPWQLLLISAKTESALETATHNLAQHLIQHPNLNLGDVGYTLQVGRREFNHRRMLVCRDIDDAVSALQQPEQRVLTQLHEPYNHPIAFMFPGQGAQYVEMGKELYQTEPIFREQVKRCCELLTPHLGLDLCSIIYPNESEKESAEKKLKQTCLAQPALFVIEYALAQLWLAWGISVQAMIGHSIGEYVAASLAGVMALEDALALVAARGAVMQQLPSGSMLSIPLPEAEIKPLLGELSLGACNAPNSCVVSGTVQAVDILKEKLSSLGVECRYLHTSHAFHSQMMEPIVESFIAEVRKVKLNPPQIPFVSNLTGTWITAQQATDPNYWARHLRHTVQFAAGISTLLQEPNRILLEVGPGRTLCTFAKQNLEQKENREKKQNLILSSLRHPKEQKSDVEFLLNTVGRLWLSGIVIDWNQYYNLERRYRIPLPTYPFERQRYWIEPQKSTNSDLTSEPTSYPTNRKKPDIADWFYSPIWKSATTPQAVKFKEQILVFVDTYIGAQITKRLKSDGYNVITVEIGEQFSKREQSEYTINPKQPNDYDTLVAQLRSQGKFPDTIVHLWSIIANEPVSQQVNSDSEFFENCQNLGFYSLLFLAQSLGKHDINQPIDILAVTNNAHDVTGTEKLNPEKATVLGICKVIPQEYANITCRCIDIVVSTASENQLIDQLLTEITASSDPVVAYRGHHRWVQTFEPMRCESATSPLRAQGVYLISGGLGGVGLEIAEYLASIQAKLILIGYSDFPVRDTWDEWLATYGNSDRLSRKILKVQELEALGAEVLILSADVANESQMHRAITQALQRFGEINGVIHAAGIKLFRTIREISISECEQQLITNGRGLFILEKLLQGIELDFCVLISSLSSVVGALGMAAYPAAHLFTDAFVHKHNQTSRTSWISVNWDNWLTSELAEKLATKPEISTDLFMTNKEGVEVFQRVLSFNKINQIVVSTSDLHSRIAQWINPLQAPQVSQTANYLPLHSRPNLSNNYVAPRNEIEQTIANIWQEILGIEAVGIYDNFLEIGGDSLLSIQITARANKAGLRITNQHLFEFPTIAQLADIASRTQNVFAEQGLVQGEIPLTPIQHWFFEQNLLDSHHWNQTIMLELQQNLDPELLKQVIQHLLTHHDALRLRFIKEQSGWKQVNTNIDANIDTVIPFSQIDLSSLSPQLQELELEATANQLQASLNLSDGPIVRVVYFNLGQHKGNCLLFVIHHLAVDVGSWRILLDDLQTAYQQLSQGKAIKLPSKTTSFKQWSQRLIEYAQSIELEREQVYWLAPSRELVSPLPIDYPNGENTVASAQTVSITLSVEETEVLQTEITSVYRVQMEDVLLSALVQATARWTGTPSLLVDLERNGREVIFDNVDLSRTVGWFTNIAPMLLETGEVQETANAHQILKVVKEQLRNFPNQGLGYGVMRYLSDDVLITKKLRSLQPAEIIFLYLGNLEQSLPQSSLFKLSQQSNGLSRSPRGLRSHLLEVHAVIVEEQLRVDWTYSENIHHTKTVEHLAEDFVAVLRLMIDDCQLSSMKSYTPSDFAEFKTSQWGQDDIDSILAAIDRC
ncbi:beta-ketoacyl synthase [Calothrix sp. NIES-4071]|nr:beta-ketoacyl synthase [Calothrix sp. NIES-4071]BAZ57649.1 beta-ketoacyl synthase [Calothrix sp. NIES-4105]